MEASPAGDNRQIHIVIRLSHLLESIKEIDREQGLIRGSPSEAMDKNYRVLISPDVSWKVKVFTFDPLCLKVQYILT